MDSKILLGVIAVTIFGTLSIHSIMIEAALEDLEIITVQGNVAQSINGIGDISIAVSSNSQGYRR